MHLEFWWGNHLESSILEVQECRRIMVEWISKKWVQRILAGPVAGLVMYSATVELVQFMNFDCIRHKIKSICYSVCVVVLY